MAFGDLKGTLTGSSGSITNPFSATGSVSVAVGDLVIALLAEQTNLTVTSVSDNLGNSYTAQNAGSDAGAVTGRMFYSLVTTAGTLTSINATCSASNDNVTFPCAVFEGPFASSPIDANPANSVNTDLTSPFTCPSTGTLAQASELVIGWAAKNNVNAWTGSSTTTLAISEQLQTPGSLIGYILVSSTASVAPEFAFGSNPTQDILGTASFKSSAGSLTPSLFTDTDTFYAPTVTPGSVTITPSLFTDTDTFYAPTVALGITQNIAPALLNETAPVAFQASAFQNNAFQTTTPIETFYVPAVSLGGQSITPSLFTDSDTFYVPALTTSYAITPSLFADTDTFYAPTVSATRNLTPNLFTDTDTFYASTVTTSYTITPSLFTDSDTFYAPTVTASYTISPALFTDSDTFYAPTLSTTYSIAPSLFTDSDTFYVPSVALAGAQNLLPSFFTDSDTFYAPTVTPGAVNLTPSLFTDIDTFYTPTVAAGAINLTPSLFTDSDTFFAPTVTAGVVNLTPNLFTDSDTFYAPTVTPGIANIAPSLFTDTDTFYVPTVGRGTVNVAPNLFADTDTFYTPAVAGGGAQALAPSFFTDSDTFFAPTITTGAVNIAPSLLQESLPAGFQASGFQNNAFQITGIDLFYGATVALQAPGQISPSFFTDTDTFFAPAVVGGAVNVSPALFTDIDTFYAPTVIRGAVTITPALFTDADVFYAPTVTLFGGGQTITPSFFDETVSGGFQASGFQTNAFQSGGGKEGFFAPTVTSVGAGQSVSPAFFFDTDIFYAPTVIFPGQVRPNRFDDTDIFFPPIVTAVPVVGIAGRYRALTDLILPDGNYIEAGTVFDGTPDWIPILGVEPLSPVAIQAYWDAGPVGMTDADVNQDIGPWGSWWRRSGVVIKAPKIYWQRAPGYPYEQGVFILTGEGASLGVKVAP